MAFDLASFKNSRVYGRKATTSASTADLVINAIAGPPTLILAADLDRTYGTLENLHATDSMKYMYRASGAAIPTIAQILANGFELLAGVGVDTESPEELYGLSTTVNPIPVDIDQGRG